jgi:anaerobic selenocysteine-containing dehydrogenase
LRDNNSWMHNSQRLVKGPNRCTLLIHSQDAQARQIKNGDLVKVASRVGQVEVPAELSDNMMPGVVCLPHGYGHNRQGIQLDVAQRHAGVSINDLTDDLLLDDLTGNAAFCGLPVSVM